MYYLTKNRKIMKKISVLMAAFMAVCMSALADDVVSVNPNPVTVSPGDEFEIEIWVDNSKEIDGALYNGFQFDVFMPEGITVAMKIDEDDDLVIAREKGSLCKSTHAISAAEIANNGVRFFCVDQESNKTFKQSKGAVLIVKYNVSSELPSGEYTGKVTGELSTSNFQKVLVDNVEFKVLVVPTKINDVSASKQTKGTYNIAGQQVEMQKGINIVDGKKVMVK